MFNVLIYLFENYYTPYTCPAGEVLVKQLAHAGFKFEEIKEAVGWLNRLVESTGRFMELALKQDHGTRIYTTVEYDKLGSKAINFLIFLDGAGVLPVFLREVIIELACAYGESPIPLSKLKVIVLMVLWSQETEINPLALDELLQDENTRQIH